MVALDDSVYSYYALEWTLDHFFAAYGPDHPFKLKLVHARPTSSSVIGFTGPSISGPIQGSADVASLMEIETKKTAQKLIDKAIDICKNKSGDARDVMIEAVEKQSIHIGSGQPWLRSRQKGDSGERKRLLCSPL
ncbi:hypothetical protein Dsin_029168 [Dipteronia sinensis]|uniref:Uncharacterized protein n=1 Tax=Dipteronia sinensis TaxID=43782 RepID=A0AAD9ZT85_9ROSI|nr:hypothetical protein Dsin_029168 [Dipteronia sinensis]